MNDLKIEEVAITRARRFLDLRDHYQADGPDGTVPGACPEGRWVVLTQSDRGHGSFLNRAATREAAEAVAAENIHEGWEPVALFDLDTLAGTPPLMISATYQGEPWDVHGDEYQEGERTGRIVLKRSPADRRTRFYDWATVQSEELSEIEWSDDDTRLPVRYDVAGVRRLVAFNTVPSP